MRKNYYKREMDCEEYFSEFGKESGETRSKGEAQLTHTWEIPFNPLSFRSKQMKTQNHLMKKGNETVHRKNYFGDEEKKCDSASKMTQCDLNLTADTM